MGLTGLPEWRALEAHARTLAQTPLASLFELEPGRVERCALDAAGLHLDWSKQRATRETLTLLLDLARALELLRWIERLFAGEPVNVTEHRAAFHMALRNVSGRPMRVGGEDVMPAVNAVLARMEAFTQAVRAGEWRGASGEAISDAVNLGIGGSDLGPRMVCEALAPYADRISLHFVSNVDGAPLSDLLARLDPARTLFVVTSKSFTTQETLANAHAARRWLVAALGEAAVARHFVAVSTNRAEAEKFGISADHMFGFWDWVGGRYSLWSAVGLPIALAIGFERFRELLAGAHAMDEHFRTAPPESNMPVLLGLLSVWNTNFLGATSLCVVPYAQRLAHFVAWLQQLTLESNGKGVDRDGQPVGHATAPVVWGGVGTDVQHAFFQMLHQGPATHPVDFILPLAPDHELHDQHRMLIANCLAQSAALMRGRLAEAVRAELSAQGLEGAALEAAIPHRVCPGGRSSNTILLPRLDPHHLGALAALYEHKTFVESVLWNVNAFDQWGVELGKRIARDVEATLSGKDGGNLDPSTQSLVRRSRN